MEEMTKKLMLNIDNIISIEVCDKEIDNWMIWHPEQVKRKLFKKKIIKGYYGYNPYPCYDIQKWLATRLEYMLIKTGARGEGPDGTVFFRPCVKIKVKKREHILYFDTIETALNFTAEIETKYPNKFLIIRHEKINE